MITNDNELAIVRSQLGHAEAALEALRREVKPKNEKTYDRMAESYIDMLLSLRAEIDAYLGIEPPSRNGTAAAAAQETPDPSR
jgi:hypothetical protein